MRMRDLSSDVCSSDLVAAHRCGRGQRWQRVGKAWAGRRITDKREPILPGPGTRRIRPEPERSVPAAPGGELLVAVQRRAERADGVGADPGGLVAGQGRSEEQKYELQALMRISYAVFCLKKKNKQQQ